MTARALRFASCVLALVALAACAGCGGSPGKPMPGAVTEAPANAPGVLAWLKAQHFDGQIVLLQFGTIDPDCQKSREGLDAMIGWSRSNVFPNVKIARVELAKDPTKVDDYYATKRCGFEVVRDPDGAAAKTFAAGVVPTAVLVDAFGRVRYRGAMPEEAKLKEWVAALRAQKSDEGPEAQRFGAPPVIQHGRLLGETKLPDLKGEAKTLADYRAAGGLVVVFADTTCPFANAALGELPRVVATLARYRIAAVVVNIGNEKGDVLSVYAKRNTGTTVVFDETDATKDAWKVESVPTVVFVNGNGQTAYRGPAIWADLGAAVENAAGLKPGTISFGVQGTGSG